ncbi:small multidrug resistance family-3 protein [Methanohalophilus levihalophilus]|uniref:YnfA family protein n=1 Tax=Methanohalophilus levihalophilus TaxID=1431282 RepID=UPI001AE73FEE|nr:YnfA family protein [Methanohalophilus levihalophilus]MBP2030813.1 small multidrug resistance family-3 protein [Methanohalophilus levihalophilus]
MIDTKVSISLFFLASLFEIGGGYLIWLWLRENKRLVVGLLGGLLLSIYGIISTLQPAHFGRVHAAHGGIFIVLSILWGAFVEKENPDRYEMIGALIALIGVFVIFYTPR